ncbi:MAG TPA: hypothetical protein VL860_02510 [Planctomycetota bacterium]|nr:hypothetical protein [Planctomycetota bacterium]
MGIKLGPNLELSFWTIGYLVLAVVLVIFNISWVSASLNGILLGRKERAVYDFDTAAPTKDYLDAIDALLKDRSLDARKREILLARSARLSYNLKLGDKARGAYEELAKNPNPDVAARAELSVIAIDYENAAPDASGAKTAGLEAAIKKLDDLAARYPQSVDVKAAQGAMYMNYFTKKDAQAWVAKGSDVLKAIKAQPTTPGNVESRRNVLMLDLALRSFVANPTLEEERATKNVQDELKRIAPYVAGVKKTPQVLLLEQYYQAVEDNAVGPLLLNQVATAAGVQGDEYASLVNTFVVGVIPTLTTPKARENIKIMQNCMKNAVRFSPKNPMNYENGAALMTRYAGVMDAQLEAGIARVRGEGDVPPAPFGNSEKGNSTISALVLEEDHSLSDALTFLKQGIDEPGIDTEHKAVWAARMVDLNLWRASLFPSNNRGAYLTAALGAVVNWHDFDPKNPRMMLTTAKVYELLGKPDDQKKWLDAAAAAGAKVGSVTAGANDFRFVTVYPGNALQVGTTDYTLHDQAFMIGGTFLVQGYTETIDSNSVTCKVNGEAVRVKCIDGIAYAMVQPDKLRPQNTFELKLSLSPQLVKTINGSFRFTVTK